MSANLDKLRELVPMLSDLSTPSNGYTVYEGDRGQVFGQGLRYTCAVAVQDAYLTPGVSFPEHQHDSIEYIICYEGAVQFNVGDKEIELNVGESIKFDPGVPHSFSSREGCWVIGITIPADKGYPHASFE